MHQRVCVKQMNYGPVPNKIDMSEIREYRSRETLGDAYRKPYAYKQLIENNVKEPFIRKDARR